MYYAPSLRLFNSSSVTDELRVFALLIFNLFWFLDLNENKAEIKEHFIILGLK